MKVVLNRCFGIFELSEKAMEMLDTCNPYAYSDIDLRTEKELVDCVLKLGEDASGPFSFLQVITIPDDVEDWYIEDKDGYEEIHEVHRIW